MPDDNIGQITIENQAGLDLKDKYQVASRLAPDKYWPFVKPCEVRVLIVVDGLDFSEAGFGLTTFVRSLLDMPGGYVSFTITLAHLANASPTQMMDGESRIAERITGFAFDNRSHFGKNKFDIVFLFGIQDTDFGRPVPPGGKPHLDDTLSQSELRVLTQFMNNGGGLFATGDHGSLGRFLCSAVPRARVMRRWHGAPPPLPSDPPDFPRPDDPVSMDTKSRNDTNRPGHNTASEFDDQSDDVPQPIAPTIYARRNGFFRYTFPHPLLCGPNGVIRVMPDHPHEGECVEPSFLDAQLNFGRPLGPEFPGPDKTRARPEIISTSSVLPGTTSSGKEPTVAQTFGGICAYDGHREKIGRVVTDATWHHFVNVNLVGTTATGPLDLKRLGFLASASGQAHLEEIKTYYRNLAVWLARAEQVRCMYAKLAWLLVWQGRVLEAVLSVTHVKLGDVNAKILRLIGRHARDVLGRFAGQCQAVQMILVGVLKNAPLELKVKIDPWLPEPERPRSDGDGVDWVDASPLLDIAFGASLVALREAFPQPSEELGRKLDSAALEDVIARGGLVGLELALKSFGAAAATIRTEMKI